MSESQSIDRKLYAQQSCACVSDKPISIHNWVYKFPSVENICSTLDCSVIPWIPAQKLGEMSGETEERLSESFFSARRSSASLLGFYSLARNFVALVPRVVL